MSINEQKLACTNGRIISTFKISWRENVIHTTKTSEKPQITEFSVDKLSSFNCDNDFIVTYNDTLIVLTQKGVSIRDSSGNIVHNILNNTTEGEAIGNFFPKIFKSKSDTSIF